MRRRKPNLDQLRELACFEPALLRMPGISGDPRRRRYLTPALRVVLFSGGPPAAPTNPAAVAGAGKVTITCTASAGATSYKIYRGTSSGNLSEIASGDTTVIGAGYQDTTAVTATTYYYAVSAVNAAGEGLKSSEVSIAYLDLTSLISYWKLEEASGSRADSYGTNTLTDNNTVTQAVGKLGNCAQFTALNMEKLSIASNSGLIPGASSFTITVWAYLDSKPTISRILSKDNGLAATSEYALWYYGIDDRFRINVAFNGASSIGLNANNFGIPSPSTWYFIIAWVDADADTLNISVNNGTANSTALSSALNSTSTEFDIGSDATGNYFDGRIDSAGFWKRVLTAAERTALYNSGSGRAITGTEP